MNSFIFLRKNIHKKNIEENKIHKNVKRLKINKYIVVYLLLALTPRIILIQFMYPFCTPLDESSTLALPAYLAGYDWSYLMGKTKLYYGYGMAVLFTPLFRLIKDPVLLYRAILSACAMMQSVPGLIAFYILGKFFNQTNQLVKLLLSIIASYCVITTATLVANEHMLYIIAWVIGWMLLELINCREYRKQNIYTCILAFTISYSLMCHERAKVFLAAVICIILLYGLLEKRAIVSPVAFSITLSLTYKIVLLLTNRVRTTIWPIEETEHLANTSTAIPIKLLKSKELWTIWCNIILGQLGTGGVFTGGILLIGITLGVWMLGKKIIFSRLKNTDVESNYFYIILFGLLTIGAIIFAQSLTWLENAKNAILDSTLSEGGRAFTYLRYYFPCVGMVLVLSLNWLVSNRKEKDAKKIMGISLVLVILLQANFIFEVIPLIEKTPLLNYIHNVYWIFSFIKDGEWTSKYTFLPACLICIFFIPLFLLLIGKGKKEVALCLLIALLGYQYIMAGIAINIPRSMTNYYEVLDTRNILEKMERDNVLPDYIGVTGEKVTSTNQPTRFIYQYFLKQQNVRYYERVDGLENAIYLTSSDKVPFQGITEDDAIWFRVKLTERQYIFFKGSRLKEYFAKNGYDYSLIE